MEILFAIIALIMAAGFILLIFLFAYGTWKQTKRAIKRQFTDDDGLLGLLLVFMGLMIAMTFFITLCALNNSIWHIDYMFAEGQWK